MIITIIMMIMMIMIIIAIIIRKTNNTTRHKHITKPYTYTQLYIYIVINTTKHNKLIN